ncbi:tescalcin b isoform X2 [Alosa alosa]|uniref:tescalcin b isoform X2 n=1 Tax=Alosa sapidissima TaxID=34773 RepID=UPI001C088563|nr:tescalcin b isoform X2 [Alosa sapidissima]XP_048102252.1 tescalcin b isoform X2 [Alosa alosa]
MGGFHSVPQDHRYRDFADKTGFSLEQIGNLHNRFKQLSHNEDTLRNFQSHGGGTVEEIGFEEFLTVMSYFRPPSLNMTEEQREELRRVKLRFLFNMHDTDNDGTITLEEYRHVVEELLSRSGALCRETAKGIADAAMLEVASISMGHMEPDEFYEGITFEHFLTILKGIEIESRMHIRFLNVDTTVLCK